MCGHELRALHVAVGASGGDKLEPMTSPTNDSDSRTEVRVVTDSMGPVEVPSDRAAGIEPDQAQIERNRKMTGPSR